MRTPYDEQHYSTAFATSVPTTAIFLIRSCGTPCRCWRYSGVLWVIQTSPFSSSDTSAFSGRSIASEGAAIIRGVPPLGLPKISSFVGRIFIPTFSASPLWSIKANTCTPRSARTDSSRFTVSSTEYLLATCKRPLPCITSPLELGSLARPSLARKMLSRPALASLLWNPLPQDLLQNLRCHCSSHSRN